jgi:riboflavin synthase
MFTGIVREVGSVVAATGGAGGVRLTISAPRTAPLVEIGGSVSVNGVCLTAESVDGDTLAFHAVPETLSRSTLGTLTSGDGVNLEPALLAGDALGGHIVQGHVDGVGRIQSVEAEGEGLRVIVEAPADLLRYCVEKGSITVEGVSLTIAELHDDAFGVALIPHTLAETTLAQLEPGRPVNLEVDVLAKYVERLLAPRLGPRGSAE